MYVTKHWDGKDIEHGSIFSNALSPFLETNCGVCHQITP